MTMIHDLILALSVLAALACGWLGLQLLRQNGRILLRLEEFEKRLDELEFGGTEESAGPTIEPQSAGSEKSEAEGLKSTVEHGLLTSSPTIGVGQHALTSSATGNGDERASRFKNHSLARSKLKRDGLKAGTPAPNFRLPRVDGRGELSLDELRGRPVLLVFSSPHCGPCNTLAPELEKFHRAHPELEVVMVSRGEPGENRAKVKEYRLTFPVLLQQQWEISRQYAMFGTPVGYLIDETGSISADVAVGTDAILGLLRQGAQTDGGNRLESPVPVGAKAN
jgi:peroxiredoxin